MGAETRVGGKVFTGNQTIGSVSYHGNGSPEPATKSDWNTPNPSYSGNPHPKAPNPSYSGNPHGNRGFDANGDYADTSPAYGEIRGDTPIKAIPQTRTAPVRVATLQEMTAFMEAVVEATKYPKGSREEEAALRNAQSMGARIMDRQDGYMHLPERGRVEAGGYTFDFHGGTKGTYDYVHDTADGVRAAAQRQAAQQQSHVQPVPQQEATAQPLSRASAPAGTFVAWLQEHGRKFDEMGAKDVANANLTVGSEHWASIKEGNAHAMLDILKKQGIDPMQFSDLRKIAALDGSKQHISADEMTAYLVGMDVSVNAHLDQRLGMHAQIQDRFSAKDVRMETALAMAKEAFGDNLPQYAVQDTTRNTDNFRAAMVTTPVSSEPTRGGNSR